MRILLLLLLVASPALAANRFWVGGSGAWDDTAHWSATSGGSGGQSVPTSSDNCAIDGSSGSPTIDASAVAHTQCANMDFTGATVTLVVNGVGDPIALATSIDVFGDITFASGLTMSTTGDAARNTPFFLTGTGSHVINGQPPDGAQVPDGAGISLTIDVGTYSPTADWATPHLHLRIETTGTFDNTVGNHTLEIGACAAHDPNGTETLGTSTLTVRSKFDWNSTNLTATGATLVAQSLTSAGALTLLLSGGHTFAAMEWKPALSGTRADSIDYNAGFNVLGTLTLDPGVGALFGDGVPGAFAINALSCTGTSGNEIHLTSGDTNVCTINTATQPVCDYMVIDHHTCLVAGNTDYWPTPGATPCIAGAHSVCASGDQAAGGVCPDSLGWEFPDTPNPTLTNTPTGTPTATATETPTPTPLPEGFCCEHANEVPSCNDGPTDCGGNNDTPVPDTVCDGMSGLCVTATPTPGPTSTPGACVVLAMPTASVCYANCAPGFTGFAPTPAPDACADDIGHITQADIDQGCGAGCWSSSADDGCSGCTFVRAVDFPATCAGGCVAVDTATPTPAATATATPTQTPTITPTLPIAPSCCEFANGAGFGAGAPACMDNVFLSPFTIADLGSCAGLAVALSTTVSAENLNANCTIPGDTSSVCIANTPTPTPTPIYVCLPNPPPPGNITQATGCGRTTTQLLQLNPTALYGFNETAGTLVWDILGHHNGVYSSTGITLTGAGIDLDGTGLINLLGTFPTNRAISIGLCARGGTGVFASMTAGTVPTTLGILGVSPMGTAWWGLAFSNGQIQYVPAQLPWPYGGDGVADFEDHIIVATTGPTGQKLYIDGVNIDTGTEHPQLQSSAPRTWTIGAAINMIGWSRVSQPRYMGHIDFAAIWQDRQLGATEADLVRLPH